MRHFFLLHAGLRTKLSEARLDHQETIRELLTQASQTHFNVKRFQLHDRNNWHQAALLLQHSACFHEVWSFLLKQRNTESPPFKCWFDFILWWKNQTVNWNCAGPYKRHFNSIVCRWRIMSWKLEEMEICGLPAASLPSRWCWNKKQRLFSSSQSNHTKPRGRNGANEGTRRNSMWCGYSRLTLNKNGQWHNGGEYKSFPCRRENLSLYWPVSRSELCWGRVRHQPWQKSSTFTKFLKTSWPDTFFCVKTTQSSGMITKRDAQFLSTSDMQRF